MRTLSLALLLLSREPVVADPAVDAPKAIVLLVVDQMRADYVDWYGGTWTQGLRRLFDKGAWLRNARYPYLNTTTCPGHFTITTGAYPHKHGMILNTWYDRATKRVIDCTDDPSSPLIGYPAIAPFGGDSAKTLLVPTIADEMGRQLRNKPRVAAFSLKASSAVALAGHAPGIVLWFDGSRWVTSTAFAPTPTPWVEHFIAAHPPDIKTPCTELLAAKLYQNDDDAAGERPALGWTRTFPHPLDGSPTAPLARWASSPATDEYLSVLARTALAEAKIGRGPGTDVLAVSFSATDVVGHQFGPRSHEIQDTLARVDASIGTLLEALDAQLGADNYVVAMTADHGVAPIPEEAQKGGLTAGRLLPAEVRKTTNNAIALELGPGKYVVQVQSNDLYLAPGAYERLVAKTGAVNRVLAALRALPGIASVFDRRRLTEPVRTDDPFRAAAALSYYPGRSGDLLLVPRPNWIVANLATNHGSPYDYDQRVPVVFFGKRIRPGKYDRSISPADIAPTLARLVGVKLPRAEGVAIDEVIVPLPRRLRTH
jgi:predicted AlkP superfamily pyrophosphatase or phosphodiesterase